MFTSIDEVIVAFIYHVSIYVHIFLTISMERICNFQKRHVAIYFSRFFL